MTLLVDHLLLLLGVLVSLHICFLWQFACGDMRTLLQEHILTLPSFILDTLVVGDHTLWCHIVDEARYFVNSILTLALVTLHLG